MNCLKNPESKKWHPLTKMLAHWSSYDFRNFSNDQPRSKICTNVPYLDPVNLQNFTFSCLFDLAYRWSNLVVVPLPRQQILYPFHDTLNEAVSFCTGLVFFKNSTKVIALLHTVHLLKSWRAKNTGSRKQIITQKLFLLKHNI